MKYFLLISFLSCSIFSVGQPTANSLLPQVDERVELLGIVYRMARPQDVSQVLNPSYSKAISNHFTPYAQHSLIMYFNSLADSVVQSGNEFGYWDALALAVHLGYPPQLEPRVSLHIVSDDAWDNRTLLTPKMVRLLQQFYKDAKCEAFFQSQASYFQTINQAYERDGVKLNRQWFDNFFGLKTTENYYAVIGLALGNGEYLRVNYQDNNRDTYTIFGSKKIDPQGIPSNFQEPIFSWLITHEYVHAFTNQLVDKHVDQLKPLAKVIIGNAKVYGLMKDTFYGNWQYLLYESLVRACQIKYLLANQKNKSAAAIEMEKQERLGFFWMKGLVKELDSYESNRKAYPNLEAFMPKLIDYFTKVAEELN